MDFGAIRQFSDRISTRSIRWALAICALLSVVTIWTVRQARMTHLAMERAAAAENAAARAEADLAQLRSRLQPQGQPPNDPAVRRTRHDDRAEIERVNRLYAEIDGLSRVKERAELEVGGSRGRPANPVPPADAAAP